MTVKNIYKATIAFLTFIILSQSAYCQLCTGSLGDPVVNITFGSGANPGAPLDPSITNLGYVATDCPQDGFYTIRNNTNHCFNSSWQTLATDHTGDLNGYMMIINASFQPSDFFVKTVDGLCGNTTYEFASWVLSLANAPNSIEVNITFSIEKTDGTVLATYNTNNIPPSSSPQWKQYGFFFKTPPNISSVVIRMKNNAPGGIGNDLALDDITFRPCGPSLKSIIIDNNSDSIQLCEGSSKNITLQTTTSAGYTSPVYQWQVSSDNGGNWIDIPNATTTTYLRTPTNPGKYLYRLAIAESGNGYIASCRIVSNPVFINVTPNPILQLSSNSPICEGGNIILTSNSINGAPFPTKFIYSFPDPNQVVLSRNQIDDTTQNTSKIVQILPTTLKSNGIYQLDATNSYGCTNTITTKIIVNKKPQAFFTNDNITCEKQSIQFNDKSITNPLTSWYWNFGDGNISAIQNPVHAYDSAGAYYIRFAVKDINGCLSDTLSNNIIINALPFTDFTLPKVCLSDPYAQFINLSSIKDHSESGFVYAWDFGDVGSVNNTSNVKDPQHVYTSTGTYNVKLKTTSNKGCVKDSSKAFTVNGSVPKAQFTIDNSNTICSKDSLTITNSSTVNFGNIVRIEVYWDSSNAAIRTIDDSPYAGKKYHFNYSPIIKSSTQQFIIKYVVYSGINCVSQSYQSVTINQTPLVHLDSTGPVCQEITPFDLVAGTERSGASGNGVYSGAGVKNGKTFDPRNAGTGNHIITYTFNSSNGCAASLQENILVYPQPSVDAGPNKTIIIGATITLQPQASGVGLSYLWSPPTFLDNPIIFAPSSTPTTDITYLFTVTSNQGCSNSDSVHIHVLNGLYIPNAFTPNRDGRNDTWKLPYLDQYPNTEVNIYNRLGEVVYHSKGANVAWDGTYKGIPQPADVYVYIIDLKNGKGIIKGNIVLIR